MESKVISTSYVIEFLNVDFNSFQIETEMKSEVDQILKKIIIKDLEDWKIEFKVIFSGVKKIVIYTRMPSNKKEKNKIIIIHIPIPSIKNIDWGVQDNQYMNSNSSPDAKNVAFLEVDFKEFDNRTDYINDSIRRAVKFCFEDGFTMNGVKVKFPVSPSIR
jgi:hypothetical protein